MLFNSKHFLAFFPIVVALYFALPHRFRWPVLLLASYYFYGSWRVEYLALLIGTTLVDYTMGRWMDATEDSRKRWRILMVSIGTNLSVLFFFKYFAFFGSTLRLSGLFSTFPELQILLPVGISFYTFQSLSYAIEVYRRRIPAERHLGVFATYVAFFPQLVAGPIERPQSLLPQMREVHRFDWSRIVDGLKLMLWGFVKKLVLADRLAVFVNAAYNDVGSQAPETLLLATYCFAIQIFCDFSGYTDIARGSARVMGFELMLNFRQPYLAESISDFWSRWHISLSTWFRDYVFIPLGGSRTTEWRIYRNILVTFLISGLWHGANWTFVVWGLLHGFYYVIGMITKPWREFVIRSSGLHSAPILLGSLRKLCTFHLVLFGWLFFRANSLSDALTVIRKIFEAPVSTLWRGLLQVPSGDSRDLLFLFLIVALASQHYLIRAKFYELFRRPLWAAGLNSLLFWTIVTYGVFDNQQFIYFQF